MNANDYNAQATGYDNLSAYWHRMSEQEDSETGRKYCAQIAAQLHDMAEAMRCRAFAAQLDADGLDLLGDFNRAPAAEQELAATYEADRA